MRIRVSFRRLSASRKGRAITVYGLWFILNVVLFITNQVSYSCASAGDQPLSPEYPFESIPNPGIPTLQEITVGATTDLEAVAMVINYYDEHAARLHDVLAKANPTRLRALYVMHIVHISHIYGETPTPSSLLHHLQQPYSHCGVYSIFQAELLDAFGLTWRIFAHDGAEHAWVEVNVDGNWEVFDATVNVWISSNGYALIEGQPRSYRALYSPLTDLNRPDAREHYFVGPSSNHLVGWYNIPRLRYLMPGLGLYYTPPAPPEEIGIYASSSGQGSEWNHPWIPPHPDRRMMTLLRSSCCAAA